MCTNVQDKLTLSNNFPKLTLHFLCRSNATTLADNGITILALKRAGQWKSDVGCREYVDNSKQSALNNVKVFEKNHKKQQAKMTTLTTTDTSPSDINEHPPTNISNSPEKLKEKTKKGKYNSCLKICSSLKVFGVMI